MAKANIPSSPPAHSRSCPVCGDALVKRPGESASRFSRRTYCSVDCRNAVQRDERDAAKRMVADLLRSGETIRAAARATGLGRNLAAGVAEQIGYGHAERIAARKADPELLAAEPRRELDRLGATLAAVYGPGYARRFEMVARQRAVA
jgi:transposase-like protein